VDFIALQIYIESQRTKQNDQIACSLLKCWRTVGLHDDLQMDNQLGFHESNRCPGSLGLIIRFRFFDLTPAFIPVTQPCRSRKQKLYPQFAADGFMYRTAMAANCGKRNYSFL